MPSTGSTTPSSPNLDAWYTLGALLVNLAVLIFSPSRGYAEFFGGFALFWYFILVYEIRYKKET